MLPKEFDKVKVIFNDKETEGILLPYQNPDFLFLKLKNGYNIGIHKKKIKQTLLLEKFRPKEHKIKKIKQSSEKPRITILHTGGTIASKVDYNTGGVISKFAPEEIINMFPELKTIANIKSKLISNMFSEDMRFKHYTIMCRAIQKEIKQNVDGIILTHGTDTLCYTSAALAFALENLPIPVIIVGSQRSSDRGSSDAAFNLICAAKFITQSGFSGIAICMHESSSDNTCLIMPPCKTRKLHTSRRDAFKVVNDKPIARINYETGKIEYLKPYSKKSSQNKLIVRDKFEEKVGLIKTHPNMFPSQFHFFRNYKGLVIEGTGLGQAPVGTPNKICKIHEKNLKALKNIISKGCMVIMASQCIFGIVQMHVYSDAIDLANIGVIPGKDMLSETAFIKLSWLLGNFPKNKIRELFESNLRGEIIERILIEDFVL